MLLVDHVPFLVAHVLKQLPKLVFDLNVALNQANGSKEVILHHLALHLLRKVELDDL